MLEIDEKMENIKEELRKENQEEMEYIKNELFSYSTEENNLSKESEAHENETSDNSPFDEEYAEFFAEQVYETMQRMYPNHRCPIIRYRYEDREYTFEEFLSRSERKENSVNCGNDAKPDDESKVEAIADQIYQNMQDLSHSPYSTLMKEPIKGKIRK